MIKKVALLSIFAIASVVSFSSTSVSAAKPTIGNVPAVSAPVMKGFNCGGKC